MSTPQTNVIGVFDDATAAAAAVQGLKDAGFRDDKIGVAPQPDRTFVTVVADGRHAEAASELNKEGAHGVQNVAR